MWKFCYFRRDSFQVQRVAMSCNLRQLFIHKMQLQCALTFTSLPIPCSCSLVVINIIVFRANNSIWQVSSLSWSVEYDRGTATSPSGGRTGVVHTGVWVNWGLCCWSSGRVTDWPSTWVDLVVLLHMARVLFSLLGRILQKKVVARRCRSRCLYAPKNWSAGLRAGYRVGMRNFIWRGRLVWLKSV